MRIKIFIPLFLLFLLSCDDANKKSSDIIDNDSDNIEDTSDTNDDSDATDLPDCSEQITETVMIPMSDGAELSAFIKRPSNSECKMPVILIQTPYDKSNAITNWLSSSDGSNPLFENSNYAYVVVDWRGFSGSSDASDFADGRTRSDDGYDAVEWIASQSWCDGNIGTWGLSALGVIQYMTASKQPPHLKASVPIFAALNTRYFEVYPGGVLREEYANFIKQYYGLDYKLHPKRDQFWIYLESKYKPEDMEVPMLIVTGWYDLANSGIFDTFDAISSATYSAASVHHRMLIGPWTHQSLDGDNQDSAYFDKNSTIQKESLKFFDKYLRNISNQVDSWDKYRYLFDDSEKILSNDAWPPSNTTSTTYYFNSDLSLTQNIESSGEITVHYNPDDPSPSIGGQTLYPGLQHGPADQSEVSQRSDALLFQTDVLNSDATILGSVELKFSVAVTSVDADVAVRLVDIYPDGTQMLITDGIQRLSLRESFAFESDVTPGEFYDIDFKLTNNVGYKFKAGHRIGLIVSGSNYPRFSNNPCNGNDFYENDGTAVETDLTFKTDGSSQVVFYME